MNPRAKGEKHNLFIMNIDGEVVRSFYCGDAVQDVAVSKDGIWCSCFDEGVFDEGISTEGLVLFDNTGSPAFQYHSIYQRLHPLQIVMQFAEEKYDTLVISIYRF